MALTQIKLGGLAAESVDSDAYVDTSIDAAHLASGVGGITEADEWRLVANVTTNTDLTANLERNGDSYFSHLGTGMTQSSGIFTFPSTGFWLVKAYADFLIGSADYADFNIHGTTDNSSYTIIAVGECGNYTGQITVSTSALVDVTNVTNVKVKFSVSSMTSVTLRGVPEYKNTFFQFIKLGDT